MRWIKIPFFVGLNIFVIVSVLSLYHASTVNLSEARISNPRELYYYSGNWDIATENLKFLVYENATHGQDDTPKVESKKNVDSSGDSFREVKTFVRSRYSAPISFYRQQLLDDILFDNTIFDSSFHLINSNMHQDFFLDHVQFNAPTLFLKNEFKDTVYIIGLRASEFFTIDSNKFQQTSYFDNCEFSDTSLIQNSDFKELYLRNSSFRSIASFQGNRYSGYADFVRSKFHENVFFTGSRFETTCDFFFSEFKGSVDFSFCEFGSKLILEGAKISQDLYFFNAILPDTLDLGNISNVKGTLDFMNALPPISGKYCYVNLLNTDLKNVKLTYDRFRLYFPTKQNSLSSPNNLNSSLPSFEQKNSIYLTLLNKFKMDGLNESFRELDLEHKDFLFENSGVWDKALYILQYYWWQYGYKKYYVIYWIIVIVFVSTLIVYFNFKYFTERTYYTDFVSNYYNKSGKSWKRMRRLQASFTYCLTLFFGYRIQLDKIRDINLGLYIVFTVYFLGLLCNAFLINWIFTK